MKKQIITSVLAVCMAAGLMTGCGKKKPEVQKDPEYGKDEQYTKEVDSYMATADATVTTDFGDIAIVDLPDTTSVYDPGHSNKPKTLVETLYLKDMPSTDKRNTEPKFVTHFSYTTDMTDPVQMAAAFVLQSADVPQSIFMDAGNSIYKYYTVSRSSDTYRVSYLDKTEVQVDKYNVRQNKKDFATVYVIPYNGGYVFMETYSPLSRNETSLFGKLTTKAKDSVGQQGWELGKKLKKEIEKNRKKIQTDKDKASVRECDDRNIEILKQIHLKRHDSKETIEARQKKAAQNTDLTLYIPVYKPENTLVMPEYDNFTAAMRNLGYDSKDNKKETKSDAILYCTDFRSQYAKEDTGKYLVYGRNKAAKKRFDKIIKDGKKEYEVSQITGKNFKTAYGIDKMNDKMWAVYYFNVKEENKELYDIDFRTREKEPICMNDNMPRVVKFNGSIREVIRCMNTIRYSRASYEEDDD